MRTSLRKRLSGSAPSVLRGPYDEQEVAASDNVIVADTPSATEHSPRRVSWTITVAVLVLLCVGATAEFTRARDANAGYSTPSTRTATASDQFTLKATGPFTLPVHAAPLSTVVSDGVRPTSGLWSVSNAAGAVLVRRLWPTPAPAVRLITGRIAPTSVAVAPWRDAGVCAFLIADSPGGALIVDVRRLQGSGAGGTVSRFVLAGAGGARGVQRRLGIGQWSTGATDLFIVDRLPASGTLRISLRSGVSGFRSTVMSTAVNQRGGGFAAASWALDFLDLTGPGRSDLIFTTLTRNTGSGRVEVHALSAATSFDSFLLDAATGFPAAEARTSQITTMFLKGAPAWVLINPRQWKAYPSYAIPLS